MSLASLEGAAVVCISVFGVRIFTPIMPMRFISTRATVVGLSGHLVWYLVGICNLEALQGTGLQGTRLQGTNLLWMLHVWMLLLRCCGAVALWRMRAVVTQLAVCPSYTTRTRTHTTPKTSKCGAFQPAAPFCGVRSRHLSPRCPPPSPLAASANGRGSTERGERPSWPAGLLGAWCLVLGVGVGSVGVGAVPRPSSLFLFLLLFPGSFRPP
jgi:hypothetical protein